MSSVFCDLITQAVISMTDVSRQPYITSQVSAVTQCSPGLLSLRQFRLLCCFQISSESPIYALRVHIVDCGFTHFAWLAVFFKWYYVSRLELSLCRELAWKWSLIEREMRTRLFSNRLFACGGSSVQGELTHKALKFWWMTNRDRFFSDHIFFIFGKVDLGFYF